MYSHIHQTYPPAGFQKLVRGIKYYEFILSCRLILDRLKSTWGNHCMQMRWCSTWQNVTPVEYLTVHTKEKRELLQGRETEMRCHLFTDWAEKYCRRAPHIRQCHVPPLKKPLHSYVWGVDIHKEKLGKLRLHLPQNSQIWTNWSKRRAKNTRTAENQVQIRRTRLELAWHAG